MLQLPFTLNAVPRFRDFLELQCFALCHIRSVQKIYFRQLYTLFGLMAIFLIIFLIIISWSSITTSINPLQEIFITILATFQLIITDSVIFLFALLFSYFLSILIGFSRTWRQYSYKKLLKQFECNEKTIKMNYNSSMTTQVDWKDVKGVYKTKRLILIQFQYIQDFFFILPKIDFASEQEFEEFYLLVLKLKHQDSGSESTQ